MIHEKNKGSKAKLRLKHSNKKMHRNMPFVGNGPPFSCLSEDLKTMWHWLFKLLGFVGVCHTLRLKLNYQNISQNAYTHRIF